MPGRYGLAHPWPELVVLLRFRHACCAALAQSCRGAAGSSTLEGATCFAPPGSVHLLQSGPERPPTQQSSDGGRRCTPDSKVESQLALTARCLTSDLCRLRGHRCESSQPAPASISLDEVLLRPLLARRYSVLIGLPSLATVAAFHAVPGSSSGCAQMPNTSCVQVRRI